MICWCWATEWIDGELIRNKRQSYYYEVPRNKKDKDRMPEMTLRLSILKLLWLWKNRKWKKCRHKDKALEKYLKKVSRI